jgi:hypothetical protein
VNKGDYRMKACHQDQCNLTIQSTENIDLVDQELKPDERVEGLHIKSRTAAYYLRNYQLFCNIEDSKLNLKQTTY